MLSRTWLYYPDVWMISLVAGCFMFKCPKRVMDARRLMGKLNDDLNETLSHEMDILCIDLG